jgi:hypothetical protein
MLASTTRLALSKSRTTFSHSRRAIPSFNSKQSPFSTNPTSINELFMKAKDGSRIESWTKKKDIEEIQLFTGHTQPKLDGWRIMADLQTGTLHTRGGKTITPNKGSKLQIAIHALSKSISKNNDGTNIQFVDGELMHPDGRDRLQRVLTDTTGPGFDFDDLSINIFDVVDVDRPFEQRHALLQEVFEENQDIDSSVVRMVPTNDFEFPGTVIDLQKEMNSRANDYLKYDYEGLMLRLNTTSGYNSGKRDNSLIKFKYKFTEEFRIWKFNETKPKGSGKVGSARLRVNFQTGKKRYFTAKLSKDSWTDEERKDAYAKRHQYYAKEGNMTYQATVSYSEKDKSGAPKHAILEYFRHRDDIDTEEWTSDKIANEITYLWRELEGKGGTTAMKTTLLADRAADSIIERLAVSGHSSLDSEKKTKQMLDSYSEDLGDDNLHSLFRLCLTYLEAIWKNKMVKNGIEGPTLLDFYCSNLAKEEENKIHLCQLSLEEFCNLFGGRSSTNNDDDALAKNTSKCVYVRMFSHGANQQRMTAGFLQDEFQKVQVNKGSTSAHQLVAEVNTLPRESPLLLHYVGYTGPRTIEQRWKLDGYDQNQLMSSLWKVAPPIDFVAYKIPDSRSSDDLKVVLHLVEFLLVDMMGSLGNNGFNQQPGGPFSFTTKPWCEYGKAKEYAHGLGLSSQADWHVWSKKNWEERNEMCLPTRPDLVYGDEFEDWATFLGNKDMEQRKYNVSPEDRVSYKEAERIVQKMGFDSVDDFRDWCKENPKERQKHGLPSAPDKEYPDEWKNWFTFLGIDNTSVTADNRVGYKEAERIVQALGFESRKEWRAWCKAYPKEKQELGLPYDPHKAYPDEWKNWSIFLGNGNTAVRAEDRCTLQWLTQFVQKEGITSRKKYQTWLKDNPEKKKEYNMPFNPHRDYGDEWEDYYTFFGKDKTSTKDPTK